MPYCFNDTSSEDKQNFYYTHHQNDYGTNGNEPQKEWKQVPEYKIYFNDISDT